MDLVHAAHLAAPVRPGFVVRFHHQGYRPHGYPFWIPASNRVIRVLADTPDGALAVARYHYGRLGCDFSVMVPSLTT
jgi:hypothetical protein